MYRSVLFLVPLCLAARVFAQTNETGHVELLRIADRSRGNFEGVSWQVELTSDGADAIQRVYKVQSRQFDFLAEVMSPARQKGNKLLSVRGNMWFYKVGLSKPVPISQRQKLTGNAAYGDIAATNYAEDYDIIKVEEVMFRDDKCVCFTLKARHRNTTYDGIKYWVSRESGTGLRAEYYTVSGKKFKSADMFYENKVQTDKGQEIPFISKMTIYDDMMGSETTTMTFLNPEVKEIPAERLNLNRL